MCRGGCSIVSSERGCRREARACVQSCSRGPWLGAAAIRRRPLSVRRSFPLFPSRRFRRIWTCRRIVRQLHEAAWRRLQSGDSRGASRDFSELLKRAPDFYPADTGLGYTAMAEKQFKQAATRFAAAVAKNSKYLPALRGQVDAELAAGDDAGSVVAIEQLLLVEPAHDDLRNSAELFRLRAVQSQLERAARERAAGHLEEAQHTLEHALAGSPANPVLLRELAAVELARGGLDAADAHARSAVQLDSE